MNVKYFFEISSSKAFFWYHYRHDSRLFKKCFFFKWSPTEFQGFPKTLPWMADLAHCLNSFFKKIPPLGRIGQFSLLIYPKNTQNSSINFFFRWSPTEFLEISDKFQWTVRKGCLENSISVLIRREVTKGQFFWSINSLKIWKLSNLKSFNYW